MNKTVSIGSPPIEVHLRRSARARRYSLRVSNADGKISLTLPLRASERDAMAFARGQEGWLRKAIGRQPELRVPEFGGTIPFEGRNLTLVAGTSRKVLPSATELALPPDAEKMPARLKAFLKTAARDRIVPAAENYACQLAKPVGRVTLRDTTSRWGSCSADGNLMFSWRLIMAPPEVLNYVAAHEAAHLVEMNHSHAFWRLVEGLMPDFDQHRRWLKANGTHLHRIRFDGGA
jgi:predicted metal-dependent hydrolase